MGLTGCVADLGCLVEGYLQHGYGGHQGPCSGRVFG